MPKFCGICYDGWRAGKFVYLCPRAPKSHAVHAGQWAEEGVGGGGRGWVGGQSPPPHRSPGPPQSFGWTPPADRNTCVVVMCLRHS